MAWDFVHKRGCGGVIFTCHAAARPRPRPRPTDHLHEVAKRSTWPDGSRVLLTDLVQCRQCGVMLGPVDLRSEYFAPHPSAE